MASVLIDIAIQVFDDIALFLIVISVITGIITILLALNFFHQKETKHKVAAVVIILITALFLYDAAASFLFGLILI